MNNEAMSIRFVADMAAIEMELQARREAELDEQLRIIMEDDARHCRVCGQESSGSTIAGCHVQACESCIVAWVKERTGQMV